jgi:acetyl-CoA carboxylase carboxyl transferase subunit beta
LPEGFQKAEYLRDHGMVDMVVHRHRLRATLSGLCRILTKAPLAKTLPAKTATPDTPAAALAPPGPVAEPESVSPG